MIDSPMAISSTTPAGAAMSLAVKSLADWLELLLPPEAKTAKVKARNPNTTAFPAADAAFRSFFFDSFSERASNTASPTIQRARAAHAANPAQSRNGPPGLEASDPIAPDWSA